MLLLVGAAALISFNAADATPWDEADLRGDDVVRLHYVGGECDHHRDVRIDEGGEQVTLTITTRSFSMSCSDVGVPRSIDAHLDAPLGGAPTCRRRSRHIGSRRLRYPVR